MSHKLSIRSKGQNVNPKIIDYEAKSVAGVDAPVTESLSWQRFLSGQPVPAGVALMAMVGGSLLLWAVLLRVL